MPVYTAVPLLLFVPAARAAFDLNMTPGVTTTSHEVYDLHMLIFWICLVIGAVVFGIMAYAFIFHRRSRGAVAKQFHENLRLEIAWTIVPLMILGGMAYAATRVLIQMDDTRDAALTVKVTGYQWRWKYDYMDQGISFFSNLTTDPKEINGEAPKGEHYLREVDNPLVLPVGEKIRFITTSNDVIHSWWVPDLGWKKDAIPGYINDAWAFIEKPGVYRGTCSELCGKGHAFMPIVVVAKAEGEFQQWVAQQKQKQAAAASAAGKTWSREDLLAKGKKIYMTICAACHQPNGKGIPNVFPDLTASKVVRGPVDDHLKVVLNGRPNTAMQAFGPQFSDLEMASVVTYERNTFGGSDKAVEPVQVKAARNETQAKNQATDKKP
ncbi:MAG: cytochrome c oxidase subunit II [Candidatus Thiodiazotropha sp.]